MYPSSVGKQKADQADQPCAAGLQARRSALALRPWTLTWGVVADCGSAWNVGSDANSILLAKSGGSNLRQTLLGQPALIALAPETCRARRCRRRARVDLRGLDRGDGRFQVLEGQLAGVLAQLFGPLAVERLAELGDQMLEPAAVFGQHRDIGLERPARRTRRRRGPRAARRSGRCRRGRSSVLSVPDVEVSVAPSRGR
jgi:hypothetical protein